MTVITRTALTDDSGLGTDGTILNNAWKTELYDQIDAALDDFDDDVDAAIAAAVATSDAAVRTVAKGGTGVATLAAHGLLIGNGTNAVAVSGAGTAGQVLTSNGASADPTFQGQTTMVASTATGAQNNWAPGLVANTMILWSGASAATITGMAGGVAGQHVTIKNTGSAVISFSHNSGSSAAGNKLSNMVTSADTPVAANGYITFVYDATATLWRVVNHNQGSFITPTFAAGNFTATGSMTWTVDSGDVSACRYLLSGKTLIFSFTILTSTLGGTTNTTARIGNGAFGGFTLDSAIFLAFMINNGDAPANQVCYAGTGGTTVDIIKLQQTNQTLTTNGYYVYGTVIVGVT
jgi:hypothetical protein